MRHVVSTLQAKGGVVSSCLCASDGESQATLVSTTQHRRRRGGHGARQSQAPGKFVSASMNS